MDAIGGGNILGTLLPNLQHAPASKMIEHRSLSEVERELRKVDGDGKKAGENGHHGGKKKKKPKKKQAGPQNSNENNQKPSDVESKPQKNNNNKEEVVKDAKPKPSKATHANQKKALGKGKSTEQNDQCDREKSPTSPPEKKKTKHQFIKRHKKKDKSPTICRNCGKSPTASPVHQETGTLVQAAPRPRDSPSRYNFRKLSPGSPLLSEHADKEGMITVPQAVDIQELNNMTAYALMQSPGVSDEMKPKAVKDLMKNSPMTSGNLTTQDAKEVPAAERDFNTSPPSSSSTMSTTNINQLLSEIHDSSPKKEAKDLKEKLISREIRSDNARFAPVDVTKNGPYIFCVSQTTNQVEVFGTDGKKAGKLKLSDKKEFDAPRNILYLPPCQWEEGMNPAPVPLKAGCVIVLDEQGLHVFAENGQYLGCLLEGSGSKFRGLASYKGLSLVTIDISKNDGVYLVLLDLRNAVNVGKDSSNHSNAEHKRIMLTNLPDKSLKCRFVTTTFGVTEQSSRHYAYVTAMLTSDVFKINLQTGSVENLNLCCPPSKNEATFVHNDTVLESGDKIEEPTGIAIDRHGNILIADRAKNRIEVFAPNGLHLGTIDKSFAPSKSPVQEPVGIYINALDGQLYVASLMSKVIFTYDYYDCLGRFSK